MALPLLQSRMCETDVACLLQRKSPAPAMVLIEWTGLGFFAGERSSFAIGIPPVAIERE